MVLNNDEPYFVISVVARIVGVHAQSLRYYERQGLVAPSRSSGNIRLYRQSDVVRLRMIKTMIDDMGVNLAGVDVVLRMMDRVMELEKENSRLINKLATVRGVAKPR
jgi:MerR family transcriptional regulator/heat shock protein HspR